MLVYWSLFAFFAVGTLFERDRPRFSGWQGHWMLLAGGFLIAVAIGLRYQVGADWETYEFWFDYAGLADLGRVLEFKDPGYQLLNWSMKRLGVDIWAVNLVCGMIFAWGLLRFCRVQGDPWLAALIAIPYLVVVVAMGYSRQAVAIGILMGGLASLARGTSMFRFCLWVGVAALFHRTAVIAIPLAALTGDRNRFINLIVALASALVLYDALLEDSMDQFVKGYIQAEYSSQGAGIRVAMNLLPAVLFFAFSRRLGFTEQERLLWRNFSVAAFATLALLFYLASSTAVDRIALYLMPMQLAILSRVPGHILQAGVGKAAVIAYSGAVLFVWLNYASHAEYWLPYQIYPF